MSWKRHSVEEIVGKLERAEALVARGATTSEAARAIGVTDATYFRWKRSFSGLKLAQVERLKQLELENARLRRAIAEFEAASLGVVAR
ncbi:MAG: transposase [Alphaproteobacteria bacterium]|nr:transposase [Alphaproteobacteria bacterium]